MNRRLIAVAALFHVTMAVLLFSAGRMQIAPRFLDPDGIVPATDSIAYRQDAMRLAGTLRQSGIGAWRRIAAPAHVRMLSLGFALAAPMAGWGILAAEWLNLACYLAIVTLTFAIGREAGGRRVGVIAAATIALWPTFVFHTTQFLKDPLFIAAGLALVFVVLTWVTQSYDWRRAAGSAMGLLGATALVIVIRPKFIVVVLALFIFGIALFFVRQMTEKHLLSWNLTCALAALAAALLALSQSTRTYEKVKRDPSPYRGALKSLKTPGVPLPSVTTWRAQDDTIGLALGTIRDRYIAGDRSGVGIDDTITIRSTGELFANLPRSAAIGLWAPFPSMWFQPGRMTGTAGRLAAGAETIVIYLFELLSIAAVALRPRRLPGLLLLLFAVFGVTMLAVVVTNIGTLYRFRYLFWILLIVTGVSGGEKLARAGVLSRRRRAAAAAVCVCLTVWGCARPAQRGGLAITNRTGVSIDALYLSPNRSATWEENILGRDVLRDGDTVSIRIDSQSGAQTWDLRVDSGSYRAEWLGLDRSRISLITLSITKGAAVAELQ